MGGGKGGNATAEQGQQQLAQQLSSLMGQQGAESQQLFNLAFPGLQTSENFFGELASGSPNLIATATAPGAQQISQATTGAKQNILQNTPAGGERNLALGQADVSQGSQLGALATQGWANSFNALGQLGQTGVGLGQGAAGTAVGAGQAAGNQWSNIVQENVAQKGASLGAFGSIFGDVTGGLSYGLSNAFA